MGATMSRPWDDAMALDLLHGLRVAQSGTRKVRARGTAAYGRPWSDGGTLPGSLAYLEAGP